MRSLKAVLYVPEAQYNLISIRVLDEEECQIQVQQGVLTVSQGDRVILEGKKYGELYKLKEEKVQAHQRREYFYHREGHWKNDCKH